MWGCGGGWTKVFQVYAVGDYCDGGEARSWLQVAVGQFVQRLFVSPGGDGYLVLLAQELGLVTPGAAKVDGRHQARAQLRPLLGGLFE